MVACERNTEEEKFTQDQTVPIKNSHGVTVTVLLL